MYYCIYEKTADGDERFIRTCDTFEDAIVVIRDLYEKDYHDSALKYYFIRGV